MKLDLSLQPIQELTINSSAGFLRKGDSFSSDRYNNILRFSDSKNFNLEYNLDYVKTKNLSLKSNWLRQKGNAFYTLWLLKPGLEFLAEDKQDILGHKTIHLLTVV